MEKRLTVQSSRSVSESPFLVFSEMGKHSKVLE